MEPTRDTVVDTLLLVVLGLSEAHAVFLLLTELVREDNHQVLTREVLLQLIRQSLQCGLIRDGAYTMLNI